MINWLEKWFRDNCDGNWEHSNRVQIETLDNPGWNIEIDFSDTELKIDDVRWRSYEISNENWVGYSIKNNIFSSAGDPLKLNLMINIFKKIIEKDKLEDEYIYSVM